MKAAASRVLAAVLLGVTGAGCGGEGFQLEEVDSLPSRAPLNQPLVLRFSAPVLPGSVTRDTVRVLAEDTREPVAGTLSVVAERVEFQPALPCRPDLQDAGLQTDRRYVLEVPGLPSARVVRSVDGRRLEHGGRWSFETVAGGPDVPLFRDPGAVAQGPQLPLASTPVLEARTGELLLEFDEPLDPRCLADAEIRLRFPWSPDSDPDLPRFLLELVENGPRARLRLRLDPEAGRQPLNPGEVGYQLEVRRPGLRDLGGESWTGGPRIDIRVEQGNPER